ncbi:TPA: hypothetical protein WI639_000327 [Neisseria meningitidis]
MEHQTDNRQPEELAALKTEIQAMADYLETLTLFAAETVLSAEMGREEADRIHTLILAVDKFYGQSAAFGQDAFWKRLNGALTRYTERFGELPKRSDSADRIGEDD